MSLLKRLSEKFGSGRVAVFVVLGLISAFLTLILYIVKPSFLTVLDLKATDAMFKKRAASRPPENVVLVAVDEKSVNELGRWPWKRSELASLVRGLGAAKVVAFDIVFSEPADVKEDAELRDAIKETGNVVLGYFLRDDSQVVPPSAELAQIQKSKISAVRYLDSGDFSSPDKINLLSFPSVEPNIAEIGTGAVGHALFNIIQDVDGTCRVAKVAYRYKDDIFPALSVEAIRQYTGSDVILNVGPYGMIDSMNIGDKTVPLDESGGLTINFYGPGGTFTTYPAVDVIKKRIPKDVFKDKIVFIGVTEKAVYDIRVTPVDSLYPGVEVHTTLVANILESRYLVNDFRTKLLNVALMVFLPLVLSFLLYRVKHTFVSLSVFSVFALFVAGMDFYLFSSFSLILSVTYPILAISLAYLSIEAYRNLIVERKSKFYRKAFSTYVPPQLVAEIIKDPSRLKLGGQKKIITVLFSDIRGFTTFSERMPPDELVSMLNEYLTPMTEIVFKEEGTLDKYIGDAIMAIFNAPLELKDHPVRACTVALNMVRKVPELNRAWSKMGRPPIAIGVGLNTGEAVVGNMGAELRFDYTAIGDAVNLASRLEGQTKTYGVDVIASEYTYRACKDSFIFRDIDYIKVKGKAEAAGVFHLMGFKGEEDKEILAGLFKDALVNYRKGKFKTAKAAFEEILLKHPNDGPSAVYIGRCEEFMENPPPSDWDGVYVAKTK
ncbi:MAG: adenylate/guanylate cyclase domain-containing protein [Thermodesulfobacteriota bacterium]